MRGKVDSRHMNTIGEKKGKSQLRQMALEIKKKIIHEHGIMNGINVIKKAAEEIWTVYGNKGGKPKGGVIRRTFSKKTRG